MINEYDSDSSHCTLTPQEIIITSGGLSEKIDNVRSITNTSSGKLGALIAQTAIENGVRVHYIHSSAAKKPKVSQSDMELIKYYTVNTARELLTLLQSDDFLDISDQITRFVHSMAVSDYEVARVHPEPNNGKLSSNHEEVTITLRQTPKIIAHLRSLFPKSKLFGFKLLSGVDVSELLTVAHSLGLQNNCDYVVANRLEDISENQHIAYILPTLNTVKISDPIICKTKSEIAEQIINRLK